MSDNRPVSQRFRDMLNRLGWAQGKLARAMGYSGASSIQRYLSPDYQPKYFHPEIVERIAKAVVGKGDPVITEEEVWDLAGLNPRARNEMDDGALLDSTVKDVRFLLSNLPTPITDTTVETKLVAQLYHFRKNS